MVKRPINEKRLRRISGSFGFIEHRFLRDGFWRTLDREELLLYVLLVLVSDRQGLSFYGEGKLCEQLKCSPQTYQEARRGLMEKDLIAFDGGLFQLLSLPPTPTPVDHTSVPLAPHHQGAQDGWKTIRAYLHSMGTSNPSNLLNEGGNGPTTGE